MRTRIRAGSLEHLAAKSTLGVLCDQDCRAVIEEAFSDLKPSEVTDLCTQCLIKKVLPIVARASASSGAELPGPASLFINATMRACTVVLDQYTREVASLTRAMETFDAQMVVLKGADLAQNVWGFPRVMADLDLLVHFSQVETMKAVMREHGYLQGRLDRERCVLVPFEGMESEDSSAAHYEIPIFRRMVRIPELDDLSEFLVRHWRNNFFRIGSSAYLLLEVDIHHNVMLSFSSVRLWERLRVIRGSGGEIAYLSGELLLLTIAMRCYMESVTAKFRTQPLHLFLDCVAIVARLGRRLRWDLLEQVAKEEKWLPALYYVTRHADEMLGGGFVPTPYVERWNPRANGNERSRDFGDFVERLFDSTGYRELLLEE